MSLSQGGVDELLSDAQDLVAEAAPEQAEPEGSVSPSSATSRQPTQADLRRILRLTVPVTAVLAERDMSIRSVLDLAAGTILEFEVPFDSDLTLRVTDRTIGSGQAVKVGENFGLRIASISSVRDRVDALGGP